MSYLEILILRHLTRTPAHGYELRKRVEATAGVTLHNNSLYPALKRFEEAGAVTKTAIPQVGRPARNVYELTDVGHEMLHDMLAELPTDQADDELEFMTRIGQFGLLTPDERAAVLDTRDEAVERALTHLRTMFDRAGGERWGSLVTAELIRRYEAEREWLRSLRAHAAEEDDR